MEKQIFHSAYSRYHLISTTVLHSEAIECQRKLEIQMILDGIDVGSVAQGSKLDQIAPKIQMVQI